MRIHFLIFGTFTTERAFSSNIIMPVNFWKAREWPRFDFCSPASYYPIPSFIHIICTAPLALSHLPLKLGHHLPMPPPPLPAIFDLSRLCALSTNRSRGKVDWSSSRLSDDRDLRNVNWQKEFRRRKPAFFLFIISVFSSPVITCLRGDNGPGYWKYTRNTSFNEAPHNRGQR